MSVAGIASVYLIFLIAAIVGGIYMIMYRRKINKALNENNGRHVNMPDGRSVIIVILAVVLFFGVYRTKYLVEQLEDNMNSTMIWMKYDIIEEFEQEISQLESQINELKNLNKLVSEYNFNIEKFNIKKGVVTYKLEVILKSVSDDTKVSVSIDESNIELTRDSSGKFVGNIDVNMFKFVQVEPNIFITQGGITTSESFGLVSLGEAWKEYFPTIIAKTPYEWKYSNKKIDLDGKLEVYLEEGTEGKFVDAYLEIDLAGYDTKKVDIGFKDGQIGYSVPLEEYLPEVHPLSILDVYVVAVDSLGYTHKALVSTWREEVWIPYDVYKEVEMAEQIFDKEGNLLTSGFSYEE